jgi:hypothetical protein
MTYLNPTNLPLNLQPPFWQSDKHLKSGDCVWLLTDIETHESRYMPQSAPQVLFKVGMYDLRTERVGFGIFGRDVAFALVKAGVRPPPWIDPQQTGIVVIRAPHDGGEEKGRYLVQVEQIELQEQPDDLVAVAKKKFTAAGHRSNAVPGIWADLVARAELESAIEAAAPGMIGLFSAGDVRRAIGDPQADVTPILRRLVRQGRLLPSGKKRRWARYAVALPPPSP